MLIRTLNMSLLFAGLLAFGCDDKGEDTAGEEADADADADSDADADADTDADADYFEPTLLLVSWQVGVREGAIAADAKYGNYFILSLIDDPKAWEGPDDEDHGCYIYFDATIAEVEADFVDSGANYGGWRIPAGSKYQTAGNCDNVSPASAFGDDPAGTLSSADWGFGLGTAGSSDIGDEISDFVMEYYEEAENSYMDGFILHNLSSEEAIQGFNPVFVYEMDETGFVDPESYVDVSGAQVLPDGYYYATYFYGFTLQ